MGAPQGVPGAQPSGTLPVLLAEGDVPFVGAAVIAEYLDETRGALKRERRLFAENRSTAPRSAGWPTGS